MVMFLRFLAAYSLCLTIFGTVGNFISFCVSYQLRNNTTFVFLAFISLSDIAAVYFWNVRHFVNIFFGLDILQTSIYTCRIGTYIQFTAILISAWLLVFMSLDRLFTLLSVRWKNFFIPRKAVLLSLGCIIFFFIGDINLLLNYGEVLKKNGTEVVLCFSTGDAQTIWIDTYNLVESIVYSYIPFTILLLTNCRLIYEFKNRQVHSIENEANRRRRRSMNRTVIFITIFFIVLTLPGAVITNLYSYLLSISYGQLVIQIVGRISSTYHAGGLVILYFTNKKFAQKLRSFFSSGMSSLSSTSLRDKTKSQTM